MGATVAPTISGGSKGATSRMQAQGNAMKKILTTITGPASYDVGGSVLTAPDGSGAWDLAGITILNPKPPTQDRMYVWNGSLTAPKLLAYVFTTGVEATAAAALNGDTLYLEWTYTR